MRLIRNKKISKYITDDKGNTENIYLNTLLCAIEQNADVITFLHNTKTRENAEKIVLEGFDFQSHIDYTTDVVSAKDPLTVKYFTIVRQDYGKFTIVIQIAKALIEEYSELLFNIPHHFSEVLTVKPPRIGAEEDFIYCLAPHFVKGYIDSNSGDFYENPNFNPSLKIPVFSANLKEILKNKS